MKYIDLHCDALTKTEGVFHVTADGLRAGGCKMQCFAAFFREPTCPFSAFETLAAKFDAMCAQEGYTPVRTRADLQSEGVGALLAVEGGGILEGDIERIDLLHVRGVRLFTLLWNDENALGYPNLTGGDRTRREQRGLKPCGRAAVEEMLRLGILVDVSHASDGVLRDVASLCRGRAPFVASHSDAQAVSDDCRNLTDEGIRLIAESGGVVGLNFFTAFLSKEGTDAKAALLAHAAHMIKTGGEDVLALGSDFDGIPTNPYIRSAADMPRLLEDFSRAFGSRIAEKIAYENALRVFHTVLR